MPSPGYLAGCPGFRLNNRNRGVSIAVSAGNSSAEADSGKQALLIDKDTLARVYDEGRDRFRKAFRNVEIVPAPDYYFKRPKREALDSLGIRADLALYLANLAVSIKDVQAGSFQTGSGVDAVPIRGHWEDLSRTVADRIMSHVAKPD